MDIQLVSYNSFFIGIINLLLSDSLIQSTFMYGILIAIAHSAHMDMKLLFEKKKSIYAARTVTELPIIF